MPVNPTNSLPLISPPGNLCVLRLSAVGDVCHTVPVVRSIQRQWPETCITWIIGKTESSLVADLPGIEFITFDKALGLAAYRELRNLMRDRRYDVLLQMQISLRASLAGLLIPAKIRLGFDRSRARNGQWLFTNARIAAQPRQHVMDGLFGFAQALGVTDLTPRWDIPIPPQAEEFARQHIPEGRDTLIISPCSSNRLRNWRNWSAENYAKVVDYAVERYGMGALITGGDSDLEREYGERIGSLARHTPVDLVGRTSLKQLLALLRRGKVLISPDSGPVHMATAVGTPVIGLYATSNPERTGPYYGRQWVVNRYPEAVREEFGRPVEQIRWGRRVRNPQAMQRISVEEVCRKLDDLLAS